MSGVFSIAAHSVLQYLPEVVMHEQTGCAHFSGFVVDIFSPGFEITLKFHDPILSRGKQVRLSNREHIATWVPNRVLRVPLLVFDRNRTKRNGFPDGSRKNPHFWPRPNPRTPKNCYPLRHPPPLFALLPPLFHAIIFRQGELPGSPTHPEAPSNTIR
jgi:hypothetical protein